MDTHTRDLVVSGYSNRQNPIAVGVTTFAVRDRMRRAVVGLVTAWAGALISLFIPVAHFVLVPGLVLVGIWIFVRRVTTFQAASQARGRCPDCGAEQDFDLSGGKWTVPYPVTCQSCQRRLTLGTPAAFP